MVLTQSTKIIAIIKQEIESSKRRIKATRKVVSAITRTINRDGNN